MLMGSLRDVFSEPAFAQLVAPFALASGLTLLEPSAIVPACLDTHYPAAGSADDRCNAYRGGSRRRFKPQAPR